MLNYGIGPFLSTAWLKQSSFWFKSVISSSSEWITYVFPNVAWFYSVFCGIATLSLSTKQP